MTAYPIRPRATLLSLGATLSLKQDAELQQKFGAWLRANSRGTDATFTVRSGSRSLLEQYKRGLQDNDCAASSRITLSLRYADTKSKLEMRKHCMHPDKINLIPDRGGHKSAVSILEDAELVIDSSGALTPHQFAVVGDVCEVEAGLFALSIDVKFSTNITSPSHGNRTMFWRAEAALMQADQLVSIQSDSPTFEYHPRPPKIGDAPRLHTVISDGRPGDLIILYGDRLGTVHKNLECHLSFAGNPELILKREALDTLSLTTSCFTARLPAKVAPGKAMVYVKDSVDDVVSNQLPLQVLCCHDQPGLPLEAPPTTALAKRDIISDPQSSDQTRGTRRVPSSGPCRSSKRRQQARQVRADKPYDTTVALTRPITPDLDQVFCSPDSDYDATIKIPTDTPNPYETSYSQAELHQTGFGDQLLRRQPSDDWLTTLADRGLPSTMMMEMDSQELKDFRTFFTRSLSEEWVNAR